MLLAAPPPFRSEPTNHPLTPPVCVIPCIPCKCRACGGALAYELPPAGAGEFKTSFPNRRPRNRETLLRPPSLLPAAPCTFSIMCILILLAYLLVLHCVRVSYYVIYFTISVLSLSSRAARPRAARQRGRYKGGGGSPRGRCDIFGDGRQRRPYTRDLGTGCIVGASWCICVCGDVL